MTLKQDIGNNKLIASLVLLIISFFSLLGYLIGERIIMTQAQNDASMLASSSGDFLISEISRFELLPSMVQMCSCVKNLLEEPDNTDIRDKTNLKLEEIVSLSDAQVVYLLDINGHTLASSNWKSKQSFVGNNYSIRPYFIDAIDNKTGRYIALGLTSKKLGYYLAKPIMSNNSIQGVLVVKIGMDILQEKLQQQFEQREEEVIISDKNDIIFISTKTDWLFHSLKTLSNNELNHVKIYQTYADIAIKPLELTDHKFLNRYARILTSNKKHYILYINTLHNIQLNVNIVVPLDKYYYTRNLSLFLGIILGLFISTFLLFLYIRDTYQKNIVNNAITDPLTGLYTRLYLQEFAPKLFLLHQRDHKIQIAIALLDLDFFKIINDTYGHSAGDKVLIEVGALIKKCIRKEDVAIRYGGEEILLILPCINTHEAHHLLEQIRLTIEQFKIHWEEKRISITISGGLAFASDESMFELINKADIKLYEAKHSGRNKIIY